MNKPTTKKIIFTQTLSTSRDVFLIGHEYDVEETEANSCITGGIAKPVTPPTAPAITPSAKDSTPPAK